MPTAYPAAPQPLPNTIENVEHLEDLLSRPSPAAVQAMQQVDGDILFLGVGGKMGPTLARMALRAGEQAGKTRRVLGVSRFSSPEAEQALQQAGIETIRCDLLDPDQVQALPDAPNIIYMAGMKFGATGNEPLTWAMNAYLPAIVCRRYPTSQIVAFSTGNIYGLTPVTAGGSNEHDTPDPQGEYAMSCLGRERIFQHFSRTNQTPITLIRLNYAVEMRYGVLVDIAQKVWTQQPIDLAMGNMNIIWQADANAMALASLAHADHPPFILNVAGPELISVRQVAQRFAHLMDKPVQFIGSEAPNALLSNGQKGHRLFGYPRVTADQMIQWIANWIQHDRPTLNKPTHFEVRDGKF